MTTVLIVDDSPSARLGLVRALSLDPTVTVLGQVSSGRAALAFLAKQRPELITMDVHLEDEDGVEVAAQIMRRYPTPILIVTATDTKDPGLVFRAVEAGALEIVAKLPKAGTPDYAHRRRRLVRLVSALAKVPVVTRKVRRVPDKPARHAASGPGSAGCPAAIVVGVSTGGPPMISGVLTAIPNPFPLPIVLVQHIAEGFGEGMVQWLAKTTGHDLSVCDQLQTLERGRIYVAPDNRHLRVLPGWRVGPFAGPPRNFQRPSIDELFDSAAAVMGPAVAGILLTGMGSDGVAGLGALHRVGALTIAQSPESCAVGSMPRTAIERGYAVRTLSPVDIASTLSDIARTAGASRLAAATTPEERHV